jgi:hypothetical protein
VVLPPMFTLLVMVALILTTLIRFDLDIIYQSSIVFRVMVALLLTILTRLDLDIRTYKVIANYGFDSQFVFNYINFAL